MAQNNQPKPIVQTQQKLLLLRKKLLEIDKTYKPRIEHFAQLAVDFFPDISKDEKQDFFRSLIHENFETFSVMNVEMSTFLRETKDIMEGTLNEAIVNVLEGNDTTQHTYAQNVELLKELSFMTGYIRQLNIFAIAYTEKIPLGRFWVLLFNLIRNMTQNQQQKASQISHELLLNSAKDSPKITNIIINFDPFLGYYLDDGIPDDYSQFQRQLKGTTDKWFKVGVLYGSGKSKILKKSISNYDGVV